MKASKLIIALQILLVITLLTACTAVEQQSEKPIESHLDTTKEQQPEETLESHVVYTIDNGNDIQVEFIALEQDEHGNYIELSIKTNTFEKVLIQDSKQYSELTPKIVVCDINDDQKAELLIYMQEKVTDYKIVEWIYILDQQSGEELSIDDINKGLTEDSKVELHADEIRSGMSINNRYHYFTKVYFYRPIILQNHNLLDYSFITKTTLGSNDDVSISLIEDEQLQKTLYEVDTKNITQAMQKWLDNYTASLVAVQTKDNFSYFNWDFEESEKINITTGQKIDGEEVIIFIGDSKDSKTPAKLHTLNLVDLQERECSWTGIYSDDNWVYEKEGMAVINIHREITIEKPYNATALVVNNEAHIFEDWLCDERYAEIETADLNNDGVDEAIITLSVGHGTGVAIEKAHIVDLTTDTEILYENPHKIIEERVTIKLKDLTIDVYIDNLLVSTQTVNEYQDDGIAIGRWEQYELKNNEITAILNVSYNKTQQCGEIYINYTYSDGSFSVDNIWYEIIHQYGD